MPSSVPGMEMPHKFGPNVNDNVNPASELFLGMWAVGTSKAGLAYPSPRLCFSFFLLIDTPTPQSCPCWARSLCGPARGWDPGSRPLLAPGLGEHWEGLS